MSKELEQYTQFVQNFVTLHNEAKSLPLGTAVDAPEPAASSELTCFVFAPHPDDEAIIGALPLRLRQENGVKVTNVAVTLGSNKERQPGRKAELTAACQTLGFELLIPGNVDTGIEAVNCKTRDGDQAAWAEKVGIIASEINKARPNVLLFPHDDDFNSSHIGTHHLVVDALKLVVSEDPSYSPLLIESEFWHMMNEPNLLIGVSIEDEARLVYAISAHTEEVVRNPYHTKHPCRMHDNVLRASEVIGGQGGQGAEMEFGMIYKATKLEADKLVPAWEGGKVLAPSDDLQVLLDLAK